MNLSLYKQMMKINMKIFCGFGIGSAAYVTLMTVIFPMISDNIEKIEDVMNIVPEALLRALDMESISSYEQFISAEYYGLFYLFILSAFVIIISINLLAKLVDRGSMAYLLSIFVLYVLIVLILIFVSIIVFFSCLFIVHLITFLAGFIVANLSIDSANTIAFLEFFQINFVGFLLFVAIGSYSLLISALFNDERNAFALALGITFIFYALDMVGKIVIELDWLRNISLFSLYEPRQIASGDANILFSSLIFIAISVTGYTLAIIIFNKRNLPL